MREVQALLWRKINMGRDHRWAGPHMSEYLDGELSDRQRRRLATHASICPDCHRVLATLRQMVSAVSRLGTPAPPSPERVAADVAARIRTDPEA